MKTDSKSWMRAAVYVVLVIGAAALVAGFSSRTPVLGQNTAANELSNAFANVAEKASPSVVFIEVEKEVKGGGRQMFGPGMMPEDLFDFFFGPGNQMSPGNPGGRGGRGFRMPQGDDDNKNEKRMVPYGQGTGFIISPDGYILTNHHVVGDADKVNVKLNDGREFEATVKGSDEKTEVALIKIDATGLTPLALGDSDKIRVGDWVIAIGNPFGLEHTVTSGIVSARGRGDVSITDYADFIQTDAAINPGNSGGPLLNLNGEVIGMNTAIYSRSGGYMGIGFAIPANMIKYIESQLRDTGTVTRGYLGVMIQTLTPELAKNFGMEGRKGVLIGDVSPDTPAARAGLKQGDVIVQFDGKPAEEVLSFRSHVASTKPGSEVQIVVMREGKEITVTVKIDALSKEDEGRARGGRSAGSGTSMKLGMTVQNLTDELAERFGYEKEQGVVVSDVDEGSAAAKAGIQPGMLIQEVNRKAIHNTREFEDAIQEAKSGKSALLLVKDGKYARFVAIKLDK